MCKGPDSCSVSSKPADVEEEEQLDRRIEQALECPCVDDLKSGPCGELFVTTFTCYHKSRAEPKGCDCLTVSLAFAECLRRHPEVLDDLHKADEGLALPSAAR
ncbi:hypothetical protein OEZ86_011993 [Tetradesmus obliquus]|uniref:CHCH domain-containing protein n=1 Tax=Tetradesmus obliquus TaxID=3088 RepID=A0A383VZF4_TETOB|nr:hypothetical protein OEZ86_011993 [Tetradesmus obliquus]|eukprot:jgi/Sobl393_1/16606/SZX70253.1